MSNTRNELAALYEDGERIFSRDVHETAVDIFNNIRLRTEQKQKETWEAIKEEGVFAVESEYNKVYGEYPQVAYGDDAMEFCSMVFSALQMLKPKEI